MDEKNTRGAEEHWLQELIAWGIFMGIGKKELMEEYYIDEIGLIFNEYQRIAFAGRESPDGMVSNDVFYVEPEDFWGF